MKTLTNSNNNNHKSNVQVIMFVWLILNKIFGFMVKGSCVRIKVKKKNNQT